jgi:hypothetical protein
MRPPLQTTAASATRTASRTDERTIEPCWWRPQAWSVDYAREQFRRACALPAPDGFIRVVQELTGFEGEGAIGAIYFVLKDRWDVQRPF